MPDTVNIGTGVNTATGDPLRTAFTKINTKLTALDNVFIQATAPTGVVGAYLWIDTSGGDINFKVETGA